MRQRAQDGLPEVAAGGLSVVMALQCSGLQAVVVLRDDLLRQLRRVAVVICPLRAPPTLSTAEVFL